MSKIGKKDITIPKDSSIKIEDGNLTITGPKGSKNYQLIKKFSLQQLMKTNFQFYL